MDEYIDLVISCLERLPKDLVIHRLTGDGPKNSSCSIMEQQQRLVLNSLHKMEERNTWQGKYYDKELL